MKLLTWMFVGLAAACYLCGPIVDPDLWWHITVGRWILAHREVPHLDYWNMFAQGTPWRAYSWAVEVLFAAVEAAWGSHGLYALKLTFALLLVWSLMFVCSRIARDYFFGGLCGVYAATATFNHFTLRPQTLVWIYYAWLLYLFTLVQRDGISRRRLVACACLMVAWSNTHLTAILAVITAVAWLWDRDWRTVAVVVAACVLGTLVTPYAGGEWITMFQKSMHPFQHVAIAEFQPATIMQYSTGFLLIVGMVLLVFLHHAPAVVAPPRLLLTGLSCIAGLAVVKFLPFAVILLTVLVCESWSHRDREHLGRLAEGFERLRALCDTMSGSGLVFLLLAIAIVSVAGPWRDPVSKKVVPVDAVDFIQEERLAHPILNSFGRGGYLMYRFSDSSGNLAHPVPIDGRTNVNPPKIWEAFMDAFKGRQGWRAFISLVRPRTILWENASPFTTLLLESAQWCRVFHDGSSEDGFSVFIQAEEYLERRELSSDNCSR